VGTFTLFHDNAIDTAALAGGSWDATLSLEQLRNSRPKLKAQSTDAQTTSTQFTMALSAPRTLSGIQLISTNITESGAYKISWYSDSGFTTLIDTTGFVNVGESIDWGDTNNWLEWEDPDFWLGAVPFIDPDNAGLDIRVRFANPITAQYIKVEIDDTTSMHGFVAIGHVYVGTAFVPEWNFAPEANSFGRTSRTSMRESVHGTRYYSRRASQKRAVIAWPILPSEDVLDEIDQIVLIHDINKPVYVDRDPENAGTSGAMTAFLATLEQLPDYALANNFIDDDISASVGFEFTQVL
jgi:hypothetical protein